MEKEEERESLAKDLGLRSKVRQFYAGLHLCFLARGLCGLRLVVNFDAERLSFWRRLFLTDLEMVQIEMAAPLNSILVSDPPVLGFMMHSLPASP